MPLGLSLWQGWALLRPLKAQEWDSGDLFRVANHPAERGLLVTIPRVHCSPLSSSDASSSPAPRELSSPQVVADPERTTGVSGPVPLMKSATSQAQSSGSDVSIHRAIEGPRPERHGFCYQPYVRGLESRPVLSPSTAPLDRVERLPSKQAGAGWNVVSSPSRNTH